jgi:hypothetical protein
MADINKGVGGSYIIDPKTNERILVDRTEPQAETSSLLEQNEKKEGEV